MLAIIIGWMINYWDGLIDVIVYLTKTCFADAKMNKNTQAGRY